MAAVFTQTTNRTLMKKYFLSLALVLFASAMVFSQGRETRQVSTFTKVAFRVPGKLLLKQGNEQKVEIEGDKDVLEKIETKVEGNKLSIGTENRWNNWNWGSEDRITVYITMKDIEGLSVSGSGDLVGQGKITAGNLSLAVSGSGSLEIEADATGDLRADVSGSGDLSFKGKGKSLDSNISGSGKVVIAAAISGTADVSVSGSGKMEASGTANEIKTTISGSGKVLAANLEVDKCEVRISGSGDVEINVKSDLDANISGSGSVSYKGNPSHVSSHASGSGKVRKM